MATTIWSNKQLYHWGSGGYIKIDASYDYYRSGANMVYSLSVTVKQTGSGSWFNDSVGCQIMLDGIGVYYNETLKGTTSSSTKTWSRTATVNDVVIPNKTTGTTSLSVRVWDSKGTADFDKTSNADLIVTAAMPILTVGTPSAAINYANFTITDSTGQTMTNYQIANSGGTVVQSGGLSSSSATIKFSNINNDRLAAGTRYENYKIRAQNSIGWGDWVTIPAFTTVNIPNASTSGDFYIGNNVTISIASANYISAWSVSASDGTSTKTGTGSGTTCTVALSDSTMVTNMLNNHSNSTSWTMTYIVHLYSDGSYVGSRTVYNTCYIPSGSYNPTFTSNNVTYDDVNSTITTITGSSKKIIKGYSNVRFTVSPMTPATGASASKYKVTANGTSQEANHTGNNLQFTFNSVTTNNYSAQATDSRTKSTTITGSYSTFIEYVAPSFTGNNTKRTNQGIGTDVNINATFSYYNWSGLSQNNIITEVKYKVGSGSWVTLTNNTDYSYLDGRLDINYTTTDGSFAQGNIYTITLSVKDRLATREAYITIPSSQPLLWKDRLNKWLGIKKKPTCALDVVGNIKADTYSPPSIQKYPGAWPLYRQVVDLTSFDQSYYFVVTGSPLPKGGLHRIKCTAQLENDSHPTWATHEAGFTYVCEVEVEQAGWGTTQARQNILAEEWGFTSNNQRPGWFVQAIPSSTPVFMLRAGGKYHLYTDYVCEWSIHGGEGWNIGNGDIWYPTQTPNSTNSIHINNLCDMIYPVGSIYMSVNNTDPGTLFGGTWEKYAGGYVYSAFSSLEQTTFHGWGTQSHALTTSEMPAHTHTGTTSTNGAHTHTYGAWKPKRASDGSKWPTADNDGDYTTSSNGDHNHTFTTDSTGGNAGHTHEIATIDVFMWKRIS